MTPKAILFDMDGVLMDSEPLHLRASQLALGDRGPGFTARDNRAFLGATDAELFRILRILFNLDASTAELVEAKRRHVTLLIRREGRPLPGVPDVPRQLRAAGVRLGLVSVSPRPVIRTLLETVTLEDVFHTVVSGDEVPRGQPAPDGLLMAARRLGVSAKECVVIEDSRNGVLAGKAAGMTVAAVPCPATSHEDFSPADLVLPSLEALPKALGWERLAGHGQTEPGT